ncbi:MAG: putative Ig domain-containing protein [Candidatus Dormibacteria bacterium]
MPGRRTTATGLSRLRRLASLGLVALALALVGFIPGSALPAAAAPAPLNLDPSLPGQAVVTCAQSPESWTSSSNLPTKGCGAGQGFCQQYGGPGAYPAYGFDNVWACSPSASIDNTPFDENDGNSFQCVDLSARFLWAVDGQWAGPGATYYGETVVADVFKEYFPDLSEETSAGNNVPTPGDVISFGPGAPVAGPPVGHTAVVVASDPSQGTFTVMSENMTNHDGDGTAGVQYLKVVPDTGSEVTTTATNSAGQAVSYTKVTREGYVDFVDFGGEEAQAEWLVERDPAILPSSPPAATALAITTPNSPTSPPNATVGQPYGFSLAATGPGDDADLYHTQGRQLYFWSIASGSLPPGLHLTSAGTIYGNPTSVSQAGPFTVQVTAAGETATQAFTIWANPAPVTKSTLRITTPSTLASPPNATVEDPYSFSLTATGGGGGYRWSLNSGSLPQGLSLSKSGVISGTAPQKSLGGPFTVKVTSAGQTASATFTVWAVPSTKLRITSWTTAYLPPAAVIGEPYSDTLAATGGNGKYRWSIVGDPSYVLPPGLRLSPSGVISGTATEANTGRSFTLRVTSGGQNVTELYGVGTVTKSQAEAVTITTPSMVDSPPTAFESWPYSFAFGASGGSGKYRWSIVGGSLPQGLHLASDGIISGAPTTYTQGGDNARRFTVQVNSGSRSAKRTYELTVGQYFGP